MRWINSMSNGVQEVRGLMRQFFRIFMVLYLRSSLSHHENIYMILFVDYMLTTNVNKIQRVQDICMVFSLYQKFQM